MEGGLVVIFDVIFYDRGKGKGGRGGLSATEFGTLNELMYHERETVVTRFRQRKVWHGVWWLRFFYGVMIVAAVCGLSASRSRTTKSVEKRDGIISTNTAGGKVGGRGERRTSTRSDLGAVGATDRTSIGEIIEITNGRRMAGNRI